MAQRTKVTSGLSFIPKAHMAEEEKTPASCPLARIQNKQVVIKKKKKRVFSDFIPKPMGIRDLRGQPAICVCTTPVQQFWYTKETFKKCWVHILTSCLPCLRVTFNGSVRCSKSSDVSGFYILTVKWGNQNFVSHHQQWISQAAGLSAQQDLAVLSSLLPWLLTNACQLGDSPIFKWFSLPPHLLHPFACSLSLLSSPPPPHPW